MNLQVIACIWLLSVRYMGWKWWWILLEFSKRCDMGRELETSFDNTVMDKILKNWEVRSLFSLGTNYYEGLIPFKSCESNYVC